MPAEALRRRTVDFDAIREELAGRCFICEYLRGNPEYPHHVLYEDEASIAFLNRYPTLYGQVLVAPRAHLERVTGDFTLDEYLALQAVVHRVGEALRSAVPSDRLYVLSIGSNEANAHVHWHLSPLPPDVPFGEQQFAALDTNQVLDLGEDEMRELALRIRGRMVL